ncbi:hypothetical protein WAF17_21015 [Bernardetia sp. ABR2-2B]|uniref:hypothetical protein n=1 Tax=Bernardetia sp. ABR2-2B TaxID=3127472 RepID=UPI0030CC9F4A
MKTATPKQIQKFHALLNELGLMQHKKDLVSEFSEGKATSSKQLTMEQMKLAIEHLEGMKEQSVATKPKRDTSLDRQRKKIIAFCREMDMEVEVRGEMVADMHNIYKFILKIGYLKKDLNDYNSEEMPKLVTQIKIVRDNVVPKFQDEKRGNWTVTNSETGETKKAKDILKK